MNDKDPTVCKCGESKPAGAPACHDCLEDAHEPLMCRCKRCGNDVIEYQVPYCPHCKKRGDWE